MTAVSATYALGTDRVLTVKIDGRVTPEAIEVFRRGVDEALGLDGPIAVCFDRSSMTAVTKDGRAALERWAADTLPRLAGRCAGWADVYDERRAASLANAASALADDHETGGDDDDYPHQIFISVNEARSWLRGQLQSHQEKP